MVKFLYICRLENNGRSSSFSTWSIVTTGKTDDTEVWRSIIELVLDRPSLVTLVNDNFFGIISASFSLSFIILFSLTVRSMKKNKVYIKDKYNTDDISVDV